jgi:4-hydroxybenzoate polyprenyltransferase
VVFAIKNLYTGLHMDSSATHHIADAAPNNWVERFLPASALPYAQLMRLERPIGWWLLLLPCWWGLALGQLANGGGWPNLGHAALLLIGAIVMRGAGCVLNDIADRDFDAKVTRTMNRPIASGRVTRMQALMLLCVLSFVGLLVLVQFNTFTIWLGIASLAIVAIYPFMKRITHWPQFVLGLAFNWGALVGWSATHASLSDAPIFLYASGILWTLAYDTIYAHQDKEDDVLIGVKSTALLFGAKTRTWLAVFFTGFIACAGLALHRIHAGPMAWLGLGAAAAHAFWQVKVFRHNDGASCLKLFKANRTLGLIFLAGLILDGFVNVD